MVFLGCGGEIGRFDPQFDPHQRWVSLDAMRWRLDTSRPMHRATGDALAALGVLRELARRAPVEP